MKEANCCGKTVKKSVRKFVGKWWESFAQGCGKTQKSTQIVGKWEEIHNRVDNYTGGFTRGFTPVGGKFYTFST